MPVQLITVEEFEAYRIEAQKKIADLEKKLSTLSDRLDGKETQQFCKIHQAGKILLDVSATQVMRYVYAGIIRNAKQQSGPGSTWVFDVAELKELAKHPERLNLKEPSNYR